MSDFEALVGYLKELADKSNAGKAWIEFTHQDGSTIKVEYKPNKRRTK